jgi:sterol desaturase/sphingolipid hydroxylase (fatty acid hydroxylase superfamily)
MSNARRNLDVDDRSGAVRNRRSSRSAWWVTSSQRRDERVLPIFVGRGAPFPLFGIMLAILHYEWVHYVAHILYQPRTRLGRWIKQYHLRHHFISEKHWFGVSNPSLDGVFGTFHGPDASEKSATTRKLYS